MADATTSGLPLPPCEPMAPATSTPRPSAPRFSRSKKNSVNSNVTITSGKVKKLFNSTANGGRSRHPPTVVLAQVGQLSPPNRAHG